MSPRRRSHPAPHSARERLGMLMQRTFLGHGYFLERPYVHEPHAPPTVSNGRFHGCANLEHTTLLSRRIQKCFPEFMQPTISRLLACFRPIVDQEIGNLLTTRRIEHNCTVPDAAGHVEPNIIHENDTTIGPCAHRATKLAFRVLPDAPREKNRPNSCNKHGPHRHPPPPFSHAASTELVAFARIAADRCFMVMPGELRFVLNPITLFMAELTP